MLSSTVWPVSVPHCRGPKFRSSLRPGLKGKQGGDTSLLACINRTPATGDLRAVRNKRDIYAFGSGLAHTIAKAPGGVEFGISINVTTPYMPITSDGKAPDLRPFFNEIQGAVSKAVRKTRRPEARARLSQ